MRRLLLTAVAFALGAAACREPDVPPAALPDLPPEPRDASRDRPVRRLSNAELSASLSALFGVEQGERDSLAALRAHGVYLTERFEYPPDPTVYNFDNNADALPLSAEFLWQHLRAVETLASELLGDAARRDAVVGCAPPATDACVDRFARTFGGLAWRRPLSPDEAARLAAVARAGDREGHGFVRDVASEVLASPQFLFHMVTGPVSDRAQRLSGYDLADRLAFLLWAEPPDHSLLELARRGALDSAAGVEAAARGMLRDPRAAKGARRFAERWLRVNRLREATLVVEPLHPELATWHSLRDTYLASFFRQVESTLAADGGDVLDLIDARVAWVDAPMRYVLGLGPLPAASNERDTTRPSALQRVDLPPFSERAGILAHPAVLALGANTSGQVSPVRRGIYVREVLLCEEIGAPPAGVPQARFAPGDLELTRASLAEHRADPDCAGCHARIDPLGFGLERFDNLGMRFAPDAPGATARTGHGELVGDDGSTGFGGAPGLAALLRASPAVRRCVVTQYARYAMGRLEGPGDRAALDVVDGSFEAGGRRFEALVAALVRSELFRAEAVSR